MIRSYWRKAHLALALISSLFLIIASVTGVILSFEPVSNRFQESHIGNAKESSIGTLIEKLESKYLEVIELKVNENQLLEISVIDDEGEFETFFADPNTGEKVGEIVDEESLYSSVRALHRSLFYGTIGRIAVGIVSFLLFLIALSGLFLIIQRQLGLKKFFSRVIKDNFHQYWHTVIGRWSFPLLMLIALSGVFLSLDRFELFPEETEPQHTIDFDSMTDQPVLDKQTFELFNKEELSNLEWIQFPFSPDIEDYYHIRLRDREIIVNQFNGSIISEVNHTQSLKIKQLIFNLHTGKTSAIWSIVIGIATLSILFFIFSGCKIALKRRKKTGKNKLSKDECSIVILYGSEGGETAVRAKHIYDELISQGVPVYLDQLNNYQSYERMEHLLVLTSTYGNGQAPENARKFITNFASISQAKAYSFSVLGFGSKEYLLFCQYAKDLHALLLNHAEEKLPLYTVNNQSLEELETWRMHWSGSMNIHLTPFVEIKNKEKHEFQSFQVMSNNAPEQSSGDSFQLTLKSPINCHSGDLLVVKPKNEARERFYSIGKNQHNEIFLSVKLHEKGICSTYLSNRIKDELIEGWIQENSEFHLPKAEKRVICICNGTGIAPFIGMAHENTAQKRLDIYWGGKFQKELDKYSEELDAAQERRQLASFQFTFSREGEKEFTYVQDLIRNDKGSIAEALTKGAIIMICGSIAMRDDVLKTLDDICVNLLGKSVEYFEDNDQIKIDCY